MTPAEDLAKVRARLAEVEHVYHLSTSCYYGHHDQCRLTCKACPTACLCGCHPTSRDPLLDLAYQVEHAVKQIDHFITDPRLGEAAQAILRIIRWTLIGDDLAAGGDDA